MFFRRGWDNKVVKVAILETVFDLDQPKPD